ncbi:uncharacterized protein LOC114943638 [Nylanderia fulva]|uniref:uncharacterized protein LOC114943638 n=1 Tax=Nylanderia fulva TaxID=613905 RepID=UPI0010FB757F|nr:uncharacterized protein LOC114943638 [Nylanderia fulva]
MTWYVVKFDDEDTVEAVPDIWYMKKNSQCYWPPGGTAKHIIVDFIKKKQSPGADWALYEANLLGSYDNYKIAQKKANKAKNTNNLSSNNEELKRKYRRRSTKKSHHKESENEYELSSETEVSSDDVIYPVPTPIEKTQLSGINVTDKNDQLKASTSVTTSNKSENLFATSQQPTSTLQQNNEYQKRVLRELHILSLKMDDIVENMSLLFKSKRNESQDLTSHEEILDITRSFPVNENSLALLENWLIDSEHKKLLSQHLSRIGGSNVKEIVRRIMYHVFTNEVGMIYSWEGAKKKKIFKDLAVASTIFSAVRLNKNTNDCTNAEIISFIKAWLVRSKDRFNNNNKNKPATTQDVNENPQISNGE